MLKQIDVAICGKPYSLVTDEPEVVITRAAQLVDQLMKAIASKKTLTPEKTAILVALHVATDFTKQQDNAAALEQRLQRLLAICEE